MDTIDIDKDGEDDLTSNGKSDHYVARFSSKCDFVKALKIGEHGAADHTEAIAIDSNDHLWITGQFRGSIDLDGDGNSDLSDGSKDYPVPSGG